MDGAPVVVVENGVVYYVRTDHIGRPVFATDGSGAKVWEATYLPFGEVLATSGNPITLRFPGQWFQAESGLHQNWMRDYDPTTGRYMQADPLGLVDGASVYGYARQNPGRYVDPRGEYVWTWPAVRMLGGYLLKKLGPGTAAALTTATLKGQNAQNQAMADSEEICRSDDDCESIRSQIADAMREIRSRMTAWRIDKYGLRPGEGRTSRRRGSYGGHVRRLWAEQTRLKNLIRLAKSRGCNYDADADYWANLPIPFNGDLAGGGNRY